MILLTSGVTLTVVMLTKDPIGKKIRANVSPTVTLDVNVMSNSQFEIY